MIIFFPSHDGAGQQCCYDIAGYLMMSSDNQWGGKPRRYHNLGVLPWNEANKIPTMSHYLGDTLPFYLCCMWQVGVSNSQNFEVHCALVVYSVNSRFCFPGPAK